MPWEDAAGGCRGRMQCGHRAVSLAPSAWHVPSLHWPHSPALCHAIPGEQGLLEAAGLRKQQQLCQAGSSSLLPAVERRKKEENLAWIWPD